MRRASAEDDYTKPLESCLIRSTWAASVVAARGELCLGVLLVYVSCIQFHGSLRSWMKKLSQGFKRRWQWHECGTVSPELLSR